MQYGDVDINGDLVDELRGRLIRAVHAGPGVDAEAQVDDVLCLLRIAGCGP